MTETDMRVVKALLLSGAFLICAGVFLTYGVATASTVGGFILLFAAWCITVQH
jgi:hypothetical protein